MNFKSRYSEPECLLGIFAKTSRYIYTHTCPWNLCNTPTCLRDLCIDLTISPNMRLRNRCKDLLMLPSESLYNFDISPHTLRNFCIELSIFSHTHDLRALFADVLISPHMHASSLRFRVHI